MSAAASATAAAAAATAVGRVLLSETSTKPFRQNSRIWRNIYYKSIQSADYTKIIDHLKKTQLSPLKLQTRPINKLSKKCIENYVNYILDLMRGQQQKQQRKNLSTVAVDSITDQIVGVQLCRVDTPYAIPEYSQKLEQFKFTAELENYNYLNSQLHLAGSLFKMYPMVEDCKKYYEVVTIDSLSSIGTPQIATNPHNNIHQEVVDELSSEMLSHTITNVKNAGFIAIQSIFSSQQYKLAMKHGFNEMATIYHRDCFDFKGNSYFPYLTQITAKEEDEAKHSLMVKFL